MKVRQVVFHTPGPQWRVGVDFREQPGVRGHVAHYATLSEQGKLFAGGPFLEADSGGMMVAVEGISREELERFATDDPAVQAGLLTFEIKAWYVAMEP